MSIGHYVRNHATASGEADTSALASARDQSADEKFATGQQQQQQQKQLPYQNPKIVIPKYRIQIATGSVRTGHQVGNHEVIVSELLRYEISIAALSKLRLKGSENTRVQALNNDDHMICYSGGDKHIEGVGLEIDQMVSKSVIVFQPISSPSGCVVTFKNNQDTRHRCLCTN